MSLINKKDMKTIRWGILGPGNIAHKFAQDFRYAKEGELRAVASRNLARAKEFSAKHKIASAYGSYEELANDPDIDVVYIAVPHSHHFEVSRLCLTAGKAVLCEKPLTINTKQTKKLIALAKQNNCFLMEALWAKFNPIITQVQKVVDSGEIGDVKRISSNFGFTAPKDPTSRLRDPHQAGGALLDIGIYTLMLPHMLWGQAEKMDSHITAGTTGVDAQDQIIMSWKDGRMAVAEISLDSYYPTTAVISGTKGYIELPKVFFASEDMTVWTKEKGSRTVQCKFPGYGYQFEIDEVNSCLRGSKMQSEKHSWQDSLDLCHTMDQLRNQWGLIYPDEG